MKFQIVTRMKSEIEVVELKNVKELEAAILESVGLCRSTMEGVLLLGVADNSPIVAIKINGIFESAMWIGAGGQEASFYGFYDRRCRVTKVLESEFAKRCAKGQYALVG